MLPLRVTSLSAARAFMFAFPPPGGFSMTCADTLNTRRQASISVACSLWLSRDRANLGSYALAAFETDSW